MLAIAATKYAPFYCQLHAVATILDEVDYFVMIELKDFLAIYTDEEIVNFQTTVICRIAGQNFFHLKRDF